MTKIIIFSAFLAFLVAPASGAATLRELSGFTSAGPTKIGNVDDGSMVYLASADKAVDLSRITLSSNGKTTTLQQLLASFDADGFQQGWPVNSDLTISTTNTQEVTDGLSGTLFISSSDMVKDPNFLVYVVRNQAMKIDRLDKPETTLVLLNLRVDKVDGEPDFKPYYHTRVENIVQPNTSKLYFYREIPTDGYTDPNYKETAGKILFKNPMDLLPTGNPETSTYFFDNIEPVQFTRRAWHIRAIGGIKFDVSQDWKDPTTYETTNVTTTGLTMNQLQSYNTTVNFKRSQNHDAVCGLLVSTELFNDLDIFTCDTSSCQPLNFTGNQPVGVEYYQYNMDVANMYVVPSAPAVGLFSVQYFRIEGGVTTATPSVPTLPTVSTTAKTVETTTKTASMHSFFMYFLLQSLVLLWV